jgi:nitrate reductase (cytochrome), electron transfer subunit
MRRQDLEGSRQGEKVTGPNRADSRGTLKALKLFLTVLIAVAFIGFVVGTRSSNFVSPPTPAVDHDHDVGDDAIAARSYTELFDRPFIANEHWESSIEELAKERPDLFAEVQNDPAARQRSLADRAERRAFAGAPPTVPHPVKQLGDLACAACHTEGLQVRGRVASPMSHEHLTNCTQCHVPQQAAGPVDDELAAGPPVADFEGLAEPGPGERAWTGAPPQTPHPTFMRSECSSCHGELGRSGMQTTHPWRTNCQQCHAPSATLDQGLPPSTLDPAMPLAR